MATKPGVPSHGVEHDPARSLAEVAEVQGGDRALVLNAGSGVVAAAAALSAGPTGEIIDCERNEVAAQAVERSVAMLDEDARAPLTLLRRSSPREVAPRGIDVAMVRVPLERASVNRALVDAWRALRPGGRCYLAGANHEGIKSAASAMDGLFAGARVVANSRGTRVVRAVRDDSTSLPASLAATFEAVESDACHAVPVALRGHAFTMCTRPGVFSWEHLDEATTVLAETMEIPRGARVLDLGCGAGVLGTLASLLGAAETLLLDADAEAVRCATETAARAGARDTVARASDVTSAAGDATFDVVVSNPPFHSGRETDLLLPREFIEQSWERLVHGGTLWLVANRTLPYERMIVERFGVVHTAHDGRRFKVLRAIRR